jgi:DNA/RNA non-specific endonuclease
MRPVGISPAAWRDRFDDIDELRRTQRLAPSSDDAGASRPEGSTPLPVAPIPLAARFALIRDIGGRDHAVRQYGDDTKRQPPSGVRDELRNDDRPLSPAAPRHNPGERSSAAAPTVEPPVDAAWLEQRERAFAGLRAEYDAARASSQADGAGLGWVEDRLGGNPNRDRPVADNRPRVEGPDGRVLVFDEQAFAAHFRAQQSTQPGSALTSLAALYEADATTLLTKHPELLTLATTAHAPNAGPAPPGRAMVNAEQIGLLDLYRADPLVAELISAYGGTSAPAKGRVAQEQLRLFGAERFAQLCRLNNAMGAVRNEYGAALTRAEHSGRGPGWTEQTQTMTETDEAGVSHSYQTTTRSFDPDAFTAWYTQQDGLANRAFAAFYGQSHTTYESSSNTVGGDGGEINPPASVAVLCFDNPAWSLQAGGRMQHTTLHPLNINDTPRLNDRNAVGFDVDAGWVTVPRNIHESRDWFETVVTGFIVGVVSYASFNTLGPWAASAMGLTGTGATVASAAVASATASAASGAISGNFAWKDVLTGAFAGGLTAGLMTQYGAAVQSAAGPAGMIALRSTVQGGIQALLGGSFRDGAIAGFATGLAEVATANINAGIDAAVKAETMTATEGIAARSAARVVGSAIRALGNSGDSQYAFASSFLSELMPAQQQSAPITGTALDDDGNLMPGAVDRNATLEDQQAQLNARLLQQGVPPAQAQQLAQSHYAVPILIRDEAVREAQQAQANDDTLLALDAIEPGSTNTLLADAGTGTAPRLARLQANLSRLAEADSLFLIERNQAFVRAQLGKYDTLLAQAQQDGDTALARALGQERSLFENTQQQLSQRAVQIDYRGQAIRYAGDLAGRGAYSAQELTQAMQRLVAGAAQDGNPVDQYLRAQLANDDKRLWLTVMGGGSIAALVGSDGSGAATPRLQRVPNGSVQVPGTGYNYRFDELGRVNTANAELTLGVGTRNGGAQRGAGGTDRLTTDEGGHIVGNRFSPPTEEFNLFAQDVNFNRGTYRVLENKWAEALAQGKSVTVEWHLAYSGPSLRPDTLLIRYSIEGGGVVEVPFRNVPRGGR